jgi:hypothetical protein
MENMTPEEYLEQRVDDQINWYDSKSGSNQRWHKNLRAVEIICAALIPFIANSSWECSNFVVGTLGVIIAICAGMSALNKYQENWLNYRATAETLKHEKFLYLTKSTPYNNENSFNSFVKRIEGLISKENSQWSRHSATAMEANEEKE